MLRGMSSYCVRFMCWKTLDRFHPHTHVVFMWFMLCIEHKVTKKAMGGYDYQPQLIV